MATVRIFAYAAMMSLPVQSRGGSRPSTDSVFVAKEPYLANETLSPTTGSVATSSAATAPNDTKFLKVQIDDTSQVHYEVTPQGFDARVATTDSPILAGTEIIDFGPNYTLSLLEAS